jgi:hypothetical protein
MPQVSSDKGKIRSFAVQEGKGDNDGADLSVIVDMDTPPFL